jgi:hypothetical protein
MPTAADSRLTTGLIYFANKHELTLLPAFFGQQALPPSIATSLSAHVCVPIAPPPELVVVAANAPAGVSKIMPNKKRRDRWANLCFKKWFIFCRLTITPSYYISDFLEKRHIQRHYTMTASRSIRRYIYAA